jgi:hypothetical protein
MVKTVGIGAVLQRSIEIYASVAYNSYSIPDNGSEAANAKALGDQKRDKKAEGERIYLHRRPT